MSFICQWLIGVSCAAMVVALADALTPAGTVRRVGRLTGGLVLMVAVARPLVKLDTTAITRSLTEYRLNLGSYDSALEETNEILIKSIIEEESAAYILDKAEGLGIDCQIIVEAEAGDENWPVPQTVTVSGWLSEEQRNALAGTIETDFAIPEERQFYESGEIG